MYIPAGLIEIHPHIKHQLATINRTWDSTLDKNLNLDILAKVSGPWNKGHNVMTPLSSCWPHRDTSPYQISTCYHRTWDSTLGKNLNLDILAKVQSKDREIKVIMSWLLYVPAGLTEIHPYIRYQFAAINRTWDSTLDKNLNLDILAKVQSQWTMKYRY